MRKSDKSDVTFEDRIIDELNNDLQTGWKRMVSIFICKRLMEWTFSRAVRNYISGSKAPAEPNPLSPQSRWGMCLYEKWTFWLSIWWVWYLAFDGNVVLLQIKKNNWCNRMLFWRQFCLSILPLILLSLWTRCRRSAWITLSSDLLFNKSFRKVIVCDTCVRGKPLTFTCNSLNNLERRGKTYMKKNDH